MKTCGVEELKSVIERGDPTAHILDVRTPTEYREGHVPESINVPLGSGYPDIETWKNDAIYVLCRTGNRSRLAVEELEAHGAKHITKVIGGYSAWEEAGYPIEK